MRQLFPEPRFDVSPEAAYGELSGPQGRPSVRVNMVTSIDGRTAIDGVSKGLGGPADLRVFKALRSLCDAVLVGAGTARAEDYGPAILSPELRKTRVQRGQTPVPAIVVISRSCDLDWTSRLFAPGESRPIVATVTGAPGERRTQARQHAEVIEINGESVDLDVLLGHLATRGMKSVLVEGGPTLNAQLAAEGLIDELCVTLSPLLAGGDSKGILAGGVTAPAAGYKLVALYEDDGMLFFRWRPA